jgi:hypothetical protein
VLVLQLLQTGLVLMHLSAVLLLNAGNLGLILSHKGLLRVVGFISKLLNNSLDLSVALPDHLLTHLALSLNSLVLLSLEKLSLELILLDQKFLFHLFKLVLMAPLLVRHPIIACLFLISDIKGSP